MNDDDHDYGISDDQIRALRDEAGVAGDLDMVTACNTAIGDDGSQSGPAREFCASVIANAEAQS